MRVLGHELWFQQRPPLTDYTLLCLMKNYDVTTTNGSVFGSIIISSRPIEAVHISQVYACLKQTKKV